MKKLYIITLTILTLAANAQTNNRMDIQQIRQQFDQLGDIYPADETVKIESTTIAAVPCHWFTPANATTDEIIILLHGGSYALGSLHSHKAMTSHFAASLRRKILLVEYALAPEHPFPAGRNDAEKVYRHIAAAFPAARIFLLGDSAGGGILVSALHQLTGTPVKQPSGVVLISPWLDLRCENESYETRRADDPILSKEEMKRFAGYYADGQIDAASAGLLTFATFPPVLILTGSREVLYDDSKHFYERIRSVAPFADMITMDGQTHVWPLTAIQSPATISTLEKISAFMDIHG
ncbi:alpha/beta hydrolase [Chitinophaga sp. G-6-1-13]|uniref:Alpha/beta hydrolase n=1 Tax=Chitinophaga fulva TaxID=2728842 RepID=A0A848GQC2_9BACT|nr:alpha/beta hydrolase [Chitinophaga fulva]NML40815.1 alpha/beta hydrolase [Chitinophaga fulva]